MEGWIAQITGFATAHPHAIGLVVFLAAASEAIVVVGALIPGTAVVLALAGVAGAAHMPVLPLVLWASAGAVLSDGISFWIGHRFGPHLRERWPFRDRPGLLLSGERFFARHGGKSVVLARFLPGVRAVVPVVAGMVGMPVVRFYTANIVSAALWAVTHVLPAAGAGFAFAQLGQVSGRLLLALLAALVTAWLAILLCASPCAGSCRAGSRCGGPAPPASPAATGRRSVASGPSWIRTIRRRSRCFSGSRSGSPRPTGCSAWSRMCSRRIRWSPPTGRSRTSCSRSGASPWTPWWSP